MRKRHWTYGRMWFLTMIALASGTASAGVWSGGGGELIKDANNPWWLRNTAEVHYCVVIDDANFGVPRTRAEKLIADALADWKQEFSKTYDGTHNAPSNRLVATQTFIPGPCNEQTLLTFQLGVLDEVQKSYLGDPGRVVGIAVRTDYDCVSLRSKGFVYIAPEAGPLALQGDRLLDHYWQQRSAALRGTLLHELGHVFGLNHSSGLMDADFTEAMVTGDIAHWSPVDGRTNFLWPDLPPNHVFGSSDLPDQGAFFGFPGSWKEMQLSFKGNVLQVFAHPDLDSEWQLIGTAEMETPIPMSVGPDVSVYLPHGQRAIDLPPGQYRVGDVGRVGLQRTATYQSLDGKITRPLFLNLRGEDVIIMSVVNGKLVPDVTSGSFDTTNLLHAARPSRQK